MFRIVTTKPIPKTRKRFFHVDPEMLLHLQERFSTSKDDLTSARKFTEVVSAIRLGGTYKQTGWNRVDGTTEMIIRNAKRFSSINFLDVGGSDGIVTWQAVDRLEHDLGKEVHGTMFDRYAELVRFGHLWFCEYRTSEGIPALLRIGPFITRVGQAQSNSRWWRKAGNNLYLKMSFIRNALSEHGRLSLVNPVVMNDPRITVEQQNVFDFRPDWNGKFEVIRASNILNPSYFEDDQLKIAIGHLKQYLKPGGLLAISRNHEDQPGAPEHATLWQLTEGELEAVDRVGDGSCIAEVVENGRETATTLP